MEVKLCALDGQTYSVVLSADATVEQLKSALSDVCGVRAMLRLVFGHKQLGNAIPLAEYGVCDGSLIYEVLPLGGRGRAHRSALLPAAAPVELPVDQPRAAECAVTDQPPAPGPTPRAECAVCFAALSDRFAMVPCGHTELCAACLQTAQDCPICRQRKAGTLRVFL